MPKLCQYVVILILLNVCSTEIFLLEPKDKGVEAAWASFTVLILSGMHTARTKYQKFETNIPRKGTVRLQSQFVHIYFGERFIYSSDRSAYFSAGK
jgi:hypothetical protein